MPPPAECRAPSFARSTFVTYSVPDLHPEDVFVLACTVPGQFPHNFRNFLKYHLAEFGAFKFLIERIATETEPQFLTSVEPINFPYLNYGDKNVLPGWMPYGKRKYQYFNYARTEGPKGDEKRVCPGEIWEALGNKIKAAADDIREGGNPRIRLIIIICGPTDVQQNILGNLEMPIPTSPDFVPEFVMAEDIREGVGPGVHSILITPNMLGAGWVVNPNFTTTNGWPRSRISTRRAACNIAPLIAKDVRTTAIRYHMMFPGADLPSVGDEFQRFRKAYQRSSLDFLFENYPATGLNVEVEMDNWNTYNEEHRQFRLDYIKRLWDKLPQAVYMEADRSVLNHDPSLTQTTGTGGWLDRTLLPNHCKVLALVQRIDWKWEMCQEKRDRLLAINASQYLPQSMAPGAQDKFKVTSSYRLACHNFADLIVEAGPTNPSWMYPTWMRSLRFENRFPDRYGNVLAEVRHPFSLQQRMDWIRALIFDPTYSELLDDPTGMNDTPEGSRDNFIRSDERSSRPVRYLAEILHFWPTDQSAARFDIRKDFYDWCFREAHNNTPIGRVMLDLQEALYLRRYRDREGKLHM